RISSPRLLEAEASPPTKLVPEQIAVRHECRYRGQRLTQRTDVFLHPLPTTVLYDYPRPREGYVAVRADDEVLKRLGKGSGAIAIVLDCSGSMTAPARSPADPWVEDNKYARATRALRQVLGTIPKGTMVSLWTFGQAEGPGVPKEDPHQVLKPTPWDEG